MTKKIRSLNKKGASPSSFKPKETKDTACQGLKEEEIDIKIIQEILREYVSPKESNKPVVSFDGVLIPILQRAQDAYGYISRSVINEISTQTGIPTSKIYGVITFYDQFSTERRGKYTIKVCSGTACQVRGGKQSLSVIKNKLGIEIGETTQDYQFTLQTVGCLGACAISPVLLINKQYYGRITQEKIGPLLDRLSNN